MFERCGRAVFYPIARRLTSRAGPRRPCRALGVRAAQLLRAVGVDASVRLIAAAALSVVCLALPAGAGAATVTLEGAVVSGPPRYDYTPSKLTLMGDSGDDHVVITASDQEWRVRDDTQPLIAGGLCSTVGPHEATCPANPTIGEAEAWLAEGNDRVEV